MRIPQQVNQSLKSLKSDPLKQLLAYPNDMHVVNNTDRANNVTDADVFLQI